ncbi:16S rRNA (guanine(527)-N(7))-methyltransferase RsmG [Blattabacterium sp. (Cryptocercus punctulatus) str. Cpu]|uniref:16S rRNA (guanine(527)-N(7))-methyltransferase RsmG n=1 Tax=Blattabacterium sp. (Cryptocercus punctulatus) str. Cpu TaxID=1075399 RepID=UPI0002387104|nr:16S rRNA (guanine(527)-N(7))-methyltransferase RsmG [Blattabacterium sp. (Cryptocercus punctulatus) str. Cpu]AEU09379.1 glucose-inhibited division protein B [Blattabacterium sp. (Cryptocercus punctulatus) str. Cpu]
MELIKKYFPNLLDYQIHQLSSLKNLYEYWNTYVNIISRKTFYNFYQQHVLFCLGIAKVFPFFPGSFVMDLGTGGGFPGIPLSIIFPNTQFILVDSIKKKIKIVEKIIYDLHLKNAHAICIRAEKLEYRFDFVVSRFVTKISKIQKWIKNKFRYKSNYIIQNGSLYLKGGDLSKELEKFPHAVEYPLINYFREPFFISKKVIWISNI